MGYKKPEEVVSPKDRWKHGKTIVNTGQDGFSVVEGLWDEAPVVAIRWNGDDLSGSSGTPQSTGWPTWFVLPAELQSVVRDAAVTLHGAIHSIDCLLTQPKGYEWGVFKVEIKITDDALRERLLGETVLFQLPQLKNRLFREWTERFDEYFAPPSEMGAPWRGKLIDSTWVGVVQTNGVSEDMNETTRSMVRDALIEQVAIALAPIRIYQYGRSQMDRINHLLKNISGDERARLNPWIEQYAKTLAGCFNIDANTAKNIEMNLEALREIDRSFIRHFGIHIVQTRHEIGASETEWRDALRT